MRQRAGLVFARILPTLLVGLVSIRCSPIRTPTFPGPSLDAIGRTLSRADAVADVDMLVYTLERVHPDLYATRDRTSFAADRAALIAQLPESLTRGEFWMRLSPLIATLGDGHTSVSYPGEEVLRLQRAGTAIFPPQLAVDDDGHVVVSVPFAANGLSTGDRIVSLNGRGADSLVAAFVAAFSGESNRFRAAAAMTAFRDLLVLHGIESPYTLGVLGTDGVRRTVSLDGIPRDSLGALLRRDRAPPPSTASANLSYRALGQRVGYLNFRSMSGELDAFRRVASELFTRIAADSDTTLIIDLRSNGGGDSRLGDEVLRYLTRTAYRQSSRKEWRMSREYRTYLKGLIKPPLGWLPVWFFFATGRALFGAPEGSIVAFDFPVESHSPAAPFFAGRTCVLIGERTFSSAVDFADAVKTYHLATLVGQETGGRPTGFGEVYVFRLPHSQLAASVSSARFVRASGDTTDHRGVVPDIRATVRLADQPALRDVALERAKACPGR